MTQDAFAWFVQDDWRVSQRLVVNLGVRYEYVTPLKASGNLLANFDPTVGIVQVGDSSNISLRNNPYLPDKNNFAPRLGFAWDVNGNGKTVIRGGGGIIYVLEGMNVFLSQQNATNGTTGLNTNPSGFTLCSGLSTNTAGCQPGGGSIAASSLNLTIPSNPNAAVNGQVNWNQLPGVNGGNIYPNPNNTANLVCATDKLCGLQATDPNLKTAYVSNWNLSLQRAFTSNLSLEVGYVGNHATKLLGIVTKTRLRWARGGARRPHQGHRLLSVSQVPRLATTIAKSVRVVWRVQRILYSWTGHSTRGFPTFRTSTCWGIFTIQITTACRRLLRSGRCTDCPIPSDSPMPTHSTMPPTTGVGSLPNKTRRI